jgi:TetR/AcrR family transcriptional regulator
LVKPKTQNTFVPSKKNQTTQNMAETKDLSTEAKILEAAKSVFLLRGLDGARMQDIADEAGINKALLHYYFRSKDKLFEMVFDHMSSRIVPDLTAIVEQDLPIQVTLDRIIHRYIDFVAENPKVPLFLITELNRNPERIKELLSNSKNFEKMQVFGAKMLGEMQAGSIKTLNPLHLFMNVMAMCIFPFVAKPMVQHVLKISDADYQIILSQRKEQVSQFVHAALRN